MKEQLNNKIVFFQCHYGKELESGFAPEGEYWVREQDKTEAIKIKDGSKEVSFKGKEAEQISRLARGWAGIPGDKH